VGVKAREYATVLDRNERENQITVRRQDGQAVTYDPKQARGVQLYSSEERRFAIGERIQFTSPLKDRAHQLANRDTGTILKLDEHGNARIRLDKDDGRCVRLNLRQMQHVDYCYAMTSHSLQGKTLSRVIYHVECDDPRNRSLLGKDMTYTAITRGESDAVIYTDHKDELVATLSRECVKPTALAPEEIRSYRREERRAHELALSA
jgi:ATP-dependent exoDNAse (exonuclease V) alpha subunit